MAKKVKLPADTNKRAKKIVDIATGDNEQENITPDLKSAAAELGRKGGLKGGPARKAALSAKRRREIAKKAAQTRWGTKDDNG